MFTKIKTLKGYALGATDGEIGKVDEFYFDDQTWAIRYLVADTGGWLSGRHVLISPHAFGVVSSSERRFSINLTRNQIEESPSLESDKPVSRQFENTYASYFSYPSLWPASAVVGGTTSVPWAPGDSSDDLQDCKNCDPHLRSTDRIRGRHVEATDGEIGRVEDFILDEDTWHIRYLLVDTRDLWPGKRVLISPTWFNGIGLNNEKIYLKLTCEAIKKSPGYADELLNRRDFETALHEHCQVEGYWDGQEASKAGLPTLPVAPP